MRKGILFILSIGGALAVSAVIAAVQNPPASSYPATTAGARAFLDEVNRELLRLGIVAARAAWIQDTYLTLDTETMFAEASEAAIAANTRYAKEASRWDGVQLPPLDRRQLDVLKKTLRVSSPADRKEAEELARLGAAMEGAYGRAKYCPGGSPEDCLDIEKITEIMAENRDPQRLRDVWEGWHRVAVPMRKDYARFVELSNKGARVLGYADTGVMWRSGYDMTPEAFAADMNRVYQQLRPLYLSLHAYVRHKLRDRYGSALSGEGADSGASPRQPVAAGVEQHLSAGRARQREAVVLADRQPEGPHDRSAWHGAHR